MYLNSGAGGFGGGAGSGPASAAALKPAAPGAAPRPVADFAREVQGRAGGIELKRDRFEEERLEKLADDAKGDKDVRRMLDEARAKKANFDGTKKALAEGKADLYQAGKSGVDLAIYNANLRYQCRLEQTATCNAQGRNCVEIGGVWIDDKFDAKTPTLVVKAQSDAYFRILELQPQMKDVYRLGNHLVWMAPSGTALVVDTSAGKEKLGDEEINKLFVAKK
jgi:Ca-activated chloride channel family protein